jgi:hypothetical protein
MREPDNYWGASATFSTAATAATYGAEKYLEDDALLCQPPGDDLDVAPVDWATLHGTFISEAETGGGSDFVGHLETSGDYGWTSSTKPAGAIVNGKFYEIAFKYKRLVTAPYDSGASLTLSLHNSATNEVVAQAEGLASTAWTTVKFHFTAPCSCNTYYKLWVGPTIIDTPPYITVYWIDQLSFAEITARVNTRYIMPAACNGPHYAVLDGVTYQPGDDDKGWHYDEANKTFYFDDKVWIETGTDNLVVHYYTDQIPEEVVADILADAGLYADKAAALAAMSYTATGITIPKVWAETGTSAQANIEKMCERVNYRFWFDYAGVPQFKPAPTVGTADFAFESFGDLAGLDDHQDLDQLRNRIVIEGAEQAMYAPREDRNRSRLTGSASDATSIATYLEHTESIRNHLFQDQASLDAMCATLLAARKDPKWFVTLDVGRCVAPLEVGDTVSWYVDLSTVIAIDGGTFLVPGTDGDIDGGTFLVPGTVDIDGGMFTGEASILFTGIIRSISLTNGRASYVCEITGSA